MSAKILNIKSKIGKNDEFLNAELQYFSMLFLLATKIT